MIHTNLLNEHCQKYIPKYEYIRHLLSHELTLLTASIAIETNSQLCYTNDKITIRSKFGCIVDNISNNLLNFIFALIYETKLTTLNSIIVTHKILNNLSIKYHEEVCNTTLIIIPNTYTSEWKSFIQHITNNYNVSFVLFESIKTLDPCDIIKNNYDAIIISSNIYSQFHNMFINKTISFKRIIFYKLELLRHVSFLKSSFKWFITPLNILNYKDCKLPKEFTKLFKLILLDKDVHRITQCIFLQNDDAFLKTNLLTYNYNENVIRCKTPLSVVTLDGLINDVVTNCLNSEDTKEALHILGEKNIISEENIIKITLSNLSNKINSIKSHIDLIKHINHQDVDTNNKRIYNLKQLLLNHEHIADTIRHRIKSQQICFVCFQPMEIKSILKCCSNSYCFECMSQWIHANKDKSEINCPLCKSPITINSHYISQTNQHIKLNIEKPFMCDLNSKIENFHAFMNVNIHKQTIVLCEYTNVIKTILYILDTINLTGEILKGNLNVLKNILNRFKHKNTNLLVIKPSIIINYLHLLDGIDNVVFFHTISHPLKDHVLNNMCVNNMKTFNVWYFKHSNEI